MPQHLGRAGERGGRRCLRLAPTGTAGTPPGVAADDRPQPGRGDRRHRPGTGFPAAEVGREDPVVALQVVPARRTVSAVPPSTRRPAPRAPARPPTAERRAAAPRSVHPGGPQRPPEPRMPRGRRGPDRSPGYRRHRCRPRPGRSCVLSRAVPRRTPSVPRPFRVLPVLQHRAQRRHRQLRVHLGRAQHGQRLGPVDRLRHSRRLSRSWSRSAGTAATCSASRGRHSGNRRRTMASSRAKPGWSNQWYRHRRFSASCTSRVRLEVSTTTGGLRRAACRAPGRDRELRQQFQQERLELVVCPVDLVDQQHRRLGLQRLSSGRAIRNRRSYSSLSRRPASGPRPPRRARRCSSWRGKSQSYRACEASMPSWHWSRISGASSASARADASAVLPTPASPSQKIGRPSRRARNRRWPARRRRGTPSPPDGPAPEPGRPAT